MDRIFLDANILFTAAHRPQGRAASLFSAVLPRPIVLLSSEYAIEEAQRNLVLKFPHVQPDFEKLLPLVKLVAQPADAHLHLNLPAKDQPIWLAALGADATHLLTGDLKDFGKFMNRPERTAGIVIQTVADYLQSLLEQEK